MNKFLILVPALLGNLAHAGGDPSSWLQIGPGAGGVTNNSSQEVLAWVGDETGDFFEVIQPGRSTSRWKEDYDHVLDKNGQWHKIGPNEAVVNPDGTISGAECKVPKNNEDCPKEDAQDVGHSATSGSGGPDGPDGCIPQPRLPRKPREDKCQTSSWRDK